MASTDILTDSSGKQMARTEEYSVLRIIERFGSPAELVKHFEEFYSLDDNWIAHLFAYETIRQSEEFAMLGVSHAGHL